MKITIAQLNSIVGDFAGNFNKIKREFEIAAKNGSELVIFPELFVTGYPARDLLERNEFIKDAIVVNKKIVALSRKYKSTGIIFGTVTLNKSKYGNPIFNTAILVHNGKFIFSQNKTCLPKNDVFDEPRYFEPANKINVFKFKNEILGISICEDIWTDQGWLDTKYKFSPIKFLAEKGATILINISASPFYVGKEAIKYNLLKNHSKKYNIPIIYVNQIGGNDEVIN